MNIVFLGLFTFLTTFFCLFDAFSVSFLCLSVAFFFFHRIRFRLRFRFSLFFSFPDRLLLFLNRHSDIYSRLHPAGLLSVLRLFLRASLVDYLDPFSCDNRAFILCRCVIFPIIAVRYLQHEILLIRQLFHSSVC